MKYRIIIGFLMAMFVGACAQQTAKREALQENVGARQVKFKSGIK